MAAPLRLVQSYWLLDPPQLLEQTNVTAVRLVVVTRRRPVGRPTAQYGEVKLTVLLSRRAFVRVEERVFVVVQVARAERISVRAVEQVVRVLGELRQVSGGTGRGAVVVRVNGRGRSRGLMFGLSVDRVGAGREGFVQPCEVLLGLVERPLNREGGRVQSIVQEGRLEDVEEERDWQEVRDMKSDRDKR